MEPQASQNSVNLRKHRPRFAEFETQVWKHQGLVFSVAYGILLDAQESLEISQEVFLKAYEEPAFLEAGFSAKSWLITVTRNLALNLRKSWWRKVLLVAGFMGELEPSYSQEAAAFLERQESLDRLREAMKHLADEDRELLSLRYAGNLKYAEIAHLLDIKLGTVMSRLARLKDKLGTLMRDNENE